jgi:hypothetical protein
VPLRPGRLPVWSSERTASGRGLASVLAGLLAILAVGACGSVHRLDEPPRPTAEAGTATVTGHVSWPDCRSSAPSYPPLDGAPIHFADSAANRTFTAVADGSGGYSIRIPAGSYVAIAGRADRSPYQRRVTVRGGDTLIVDLLVSLPTG